MECVNGKRLFGTRAELDPTALSILSCMNGR